MIFGFQRAQIVLPGARKKFIHVVMQVPVNQYFPFMLVKPNPIAAAAAVNVKLGIRENFVTSHNMAAIRAKL